MFAIYNSIAEFIKNWFEVIFIVIAGTLATGYSVFQVIRDKRKDIEIAEREKLIDQRNDELKKETQKANEAQQRMIDYTTGGNSFPFVQISDWVGNVGVVSLVNTNPNNHSINPLQNISVSIYSLQKYTTLKEVEKKPAREIRNESRVFLGSVAWLSPHTATEVGTLDLGDFLGGERKFNAIIEANGKIYLEQIVIRKKLDKLYFGICLRDANEKFLKTIYQLGFLDKGEDQIKFHSITLGKFISDENGNLLAK
jgi:hypothetical protein